jgi:hypothetical protein
LWDCALDRFAGTGCYKVRDRVGANVRAMRFPYLLVRLLAMLLAAFVANKVFCAVASEYEPEYQHKY